MLPIHSNFNQHHPSTDVKQKQVHSLNRVITKALGQEQDFDQFFTRIINNQPKIPIGNVDDDEAMRKSDSFATRMYSKLMNDLSNENLEIVIQTLDNLDDKCSDPRKGYQLVRLKFPQKLKELLNRKEDFLREKAVRCLRKLYALESVKELVIEVQFLHKIKDMVNDPRQNVRIEVARLLERISSVYSNEMVDLGFIPLLLKSCNDYDEVVNFHLKILKYLINRAEKNDIINNWKGWKTLVGLLEKKSSSTLIDTLECLSELVASPIGKCVACEAKLLNKVVPLLGHYDQFVRTAAARTIMLATMGGLIKFRFKKSSTLLRRLVELCNGQQFHTKLYSIKALTHICEHNTKSRSFVQNNYMHQLDNISVKKDQALTLHKKILLDVTRKKN